MTGELAQIQENGNVRGEHPVFHEDMLSRFIIFVGSGSERTVKTYRYGVKRFLSFLRDRGVRCPTRDDVLEFRDELRKAGRKTATIKLYIESVKLFSAWLASEELYPDIADRVKIKDTTAAIHKKKALTPAQITAMLEKIEHSTLKGKRDYAMFLLMLNCGLRTIEVIRANVGHLDIIGGRTVLYIHGKGHDEADEIVKVPTLTEGAIRAYLAERESVRNDDPLFISISNRNKGSRLTTRTVSGMIKQLLREIGSGDDERLSAHSLRHTMVTEFLNNGGSIREAQQAARHKRLDTTMIYAEELDILANTCSASVEASLIGGSAHRRKE